jgi:hypothetical protein
MGKTRNMRTCLCLHTYSVEKITRNENLSLPAYSVEKITTNENLSKRYRCVRNGGNLNGGGGSILFRKNERFKFQKDALNHKNAFIVSSIIHLITAIDQQRHISSYSFIVPFY